MYSNGRATICRRCEVSTLNHNAQLCSRPVFAAGTRHQKWRTRRNIRLDTRSPCKQLPRLHTGYQARSSPAKVYRARMRGDGDLPKEETRREHPRSERQPKSTGYVVCPFSSYSSQKPQTQDMYRL